MKHLKTLVTLFLLVIGTGMSWAEFKDFEIDLMHETVTLPDGVTATNDGQNGPYYNGGHGWANYVFAFTTNESFKLTLQKCFYGGDACIKVGNAKTGEVVATLNTKQTEANCDGQVSCVYESDGTEKTFYVLCGPYCHYAKVEKVGGDTPKPQKFGFCIDLMNATVTLPDGVTATNDGQNEPYYNGGHGWANYVFAFTTNESFKLTLQKCFYGGDACIKVGNAKTGEVVATLNTKQTEANCDGEVSCVYESDGTENTFYVLCGPYCHFAKVEEVESSDPVEEVMALITSIGYVEYTDECCEAIKAARKAYDALTDEQKAKVTNAYVLFAAEESIKALTPAVVTERTAMWAWDDAGAYDQILAESIIGTYSTAYIHSDVPGVSIEVNTAEGATKIDRSGAIYVFTLPKNSVIKVPVRRIDDVVTVVCGQDKCNYTIGSSKVVATGSEMQYIANQADADKGYVEIKTTGETCVFSIKVDQLGFSAILPLITLNAEGWASFTSLVKGYVVTCPVGAQAYVATSVDAGDGEYGKVTLTKVDKFSYGEGVFIKGEKNTQIYANIIADKSVKSDVPTVEGHEYTIGCVEDVPLFQKSNAYVIATYKMNTSKEEAGFYHVNTSITVPAGKAYLYAPKVNGAKYLNIVFADGEEATGIGSVLAGAEAKTPTVFYNLAGQVVGKDYKGIVIGNDGKKYVK